MLNVVKGAREDTATAISQESLKATASVAQSFVCRWTVAGVTLKRDIAGPVLWLLRGTFGQLFQPGYAGLQQALHDWALCTPHGCL